MNKNQNIQSRVKENKDASPYFHFITKKRRKAEKTCSSKPEISIYESPTNSLDNFNVASNMKRKQTTPYFNKKQLINNICYQRNKKMLSNSAYLKESKDCDIQNEVIDISEDVAPTQHKDSNSSVFISSDFLEDGQVALHAKGDQNEEPCIIHVKDEQIDLFDEPLDSMILSEESNEEVSLQSHVNIMEYDSEDLVNGTGSLSCPDNELRVEPSRTTKRSLAMELKIGTEKSVHSIKTFSGIKKTDESKLSSKKDFSRRSASDEDLRGVKSDNEFRESNLDDHSQCKEEADEDVSRTFKRYRCKLCKKLFTTFVEARHHAKFFHSSAVYEQNLRSKTASPFFHCPDCDRNFPTERGRNKHHVMIHLKNQPIRCTECSRAFNTFRPMERHLRLVHYMTPEIFCEICDEEFVMKSSLDHHMEAAHPSDSKELANLHLTSVKRKEIPCPICQKTFRSVRSLQDHHMGEHNGMAYNCNHCKIYRTKSATALKRHLAQVHKAVNLDLYTCVICKSGYQNPQDLEDHYVCVHKRPLNNHCLLCGEKFACSEMLRFHKGQHRAFTCVFCYLGFMKEETLEEHMKTVHSNDWPKETDALFEENIEFPDNYELDCPIMELPDVSDEKDSTSKVLEINCDGSIEVKDENISVVDNVKGDMTCSADGNSGESQDDNDKAESSEAVDIDVLLKSIRVKDLPKKVSCPVCNKLLTSKFLKTHLLSHQGSFPHKCHVCPKAYAQGTLLRKHMKNRHPEEFLKMGNKNPKKKVIQCEYCEKVFYDIFPLEDHLWEHMNEKYYKCETCGIKFGMKSNWMEHYRNHYFKEEKLCSSCGRAFKSVGFYREHTVRCLSNWKCEECGVECESEELYRKHQKINHLSRGPLYKCAECDKTFSTKFSYEDHLVAHSTEKKFSCDQCNKVFKRRRPLHEHIQRYHSVVNHICNYCSLSFNSAVDLQLHKKEHLIETPCPECAAIFMSQKTLDNHIAIHHSILKQDHICPQCAQVFGKQNDLKIHLHKHYATQVYICNVNNCHKVFKKELLLRSHTARLHSHLEYFCHICLKKFILDTDLQRHIATHNKESSLKVLKCKTFLKNKGSLQGQTDGLTAELPYECSFCGVKLQHKYNILKHVETIHNIAENLSDYIIVSRWKCSICEKLLLTHNSMLKHLQQHSSHGVTAAEGNLIKFALSLPLHSISTNTPIESLNVWWEDLIPSLKVQLVEQSDQSSHGTMVKVGTNTWQCPVCFIMTNSEENMKKHLLSSALCQETLLTSLTEKFSNENFNDKLLIKEVSEVDKNVQYVVVDNELGSKVVDNELGSKVVDNELGSKVVENKLGSKVVDNELGSKVHENELGSKVHENSENAYVFEESGIQIVVDGEERNISEFLNNDDEIIRTLPTLEMFERKCLNPNEDAVNLELSNSLLNASGIFIQMKDGQLIIPDMDSGVTQYHLVNEEIDEQGTTESTYEII